MRKHFLRALALAALAAAALLIPATASAAPPTNDDFANATVIDPSSLPFSGSVNVTDATSESGEPGCTGPPDSRSVWYDYTPVADQLLRLRATGESSTTLSVYTGSSVASLSGVSGCWYFGSPILVNAKAGTTYHIRVAAFPFDPGGVLTLDVENVPAPSNDDFANATAISSLPFSDSVDTAGASVEADEPSPSCFGADHTIWYAFTPAASGSYTASSNASLAAYTGSSLGALSEVGCRYYGGPLTFHVQAGTTYYLQESDSGGLLQFGLDVAANPVASFGYYPGDPSVFDSVGFYDQSYDPGGNSFSSEVWHFGDGATASNPGCCPTHEYAKDGDYTVELDVTTTDGRTASTQQVIHVRTHDVSIAKVTVPQTASVGQTRGISVGLTNSRYPETVQVQLLKSVAGGGWQQVGALTQYVPVRGANRTTSFTFNYTFAPEDAALGKVSFQAVATVQGARDAFLADNTFISLPTKVTK